MDKNEKIMVFDTETVNIEKCFCYNVGYVIVDLNGQVFEQKDFVVEQMWNNKALFETSYYANKKTLYVSALRGRRARLKKYGFIMREMINDIKKYNITKAFAYNSNFDTKVFDFNCEWYKCSNPLDYVETFDIWGFTSELVSKRLDNNNYKNFCQHNNLISDSGNIQNNANAWGKYLLNNMEWEEEHTALSDSLIETQILLYCLEYLNIDHYKVNKCIAIDTPQKKKLKVIDTNGEMFVFDYYKMIKRLDTIFLK